MLRSYGNCCQLEDALKLMRSSIATITSPEDSTTLFKFYSAGIEVCCHNNDNDTALNLLHEMVDKTNHKVPIPRNCYLLLFSHFSTSIEGKNRTEIKTFLDDMYECYLLTR